jgi:hypothetical protein
MKIKEEWWLEDQAILAKQNDRVADSLRGQMESGVIGTENMSAEDRAAIRVGQGPRPNFKVPDLFIKGAMARKNRQ